MQIRDTIQSWKRSLWSKNLSRRHKIIRLAITGLVLLFIVYGFFLSPPANFPSGIIVSIRKGSTVDNISLLLAEKSIIRSRNTFRLAVWIFSGGRDTVIEGDYLFKDTYTVLGIARRLTTGRFDLDQMKVTITEGMSNREIATLLNQRLPNFKTDLFLTEAGKVEGMLFPETYFFRRTVTADEVVDEMTAMFDQKIKPLRFTIVSSGHTLNEILTMASIIESEARTTESRRLIAGILWKRIEQKMKLQVDAVFPYILNKYSLQLTKSDLASDSPYNTYKYVGLPPGPIVNPGLDAIKAALEPQSSNYLYYLSDRNGIIHYAVTYQEHLANKNKYLNN